MILLAEQAKRCGVYVFHDKDGHADRYVGEFLKGLREVTDHLLVVVNGEIDEESRAMVLAYADDLMIRPNEGYDITAYKKGLFRYGYEKLLEYDEAYICNDTLFGPIHPFSEMFDAMAGRDLDFWGITAFHEVPFDPFGTVRYGYLPQHIQSFFQVFRKDFMKTADFLNWWENMPAIENYVQAIGTHEAVFTKEMQDRGYKWDVYCDPAPLEGFTWDPLRDFPRYLMETQRCPVIKRRNFFQDYGEAVGRSGGEATLEAFEYIRDETDYDADLIWENLLRTVNMADLRKRLHLNYTVSTKIPHKKAADAGCSSASAADIAGQSGRKEDGPAVRREPSQEERGRSEDLRTALVCHVYYEDLAEGCASYAANMPAGIDFYVTVPDERRLESVRKAFGPLEKDHKIEYRITGNRGRDVAPFLVGVKDIIEKYDLILKVHDKKVKQASPLSIGRSWEYECFQCLLPTRTFVENVIDLFRKNPRLGLLTPPVPIHGPYFPTTGKGEWGVNYDVTEELAGKLGIKAPMDPQKEPVAPLGSEFWVRTDAMKTLFAHDWNYDEFPEEPVAIDATVLHAIERLYPFAVQADGYYTGWLLSDTFGKIEMDNLTYMNAGLTCAESERIGRWAPFHELVDAVEKS